MEMENAFFRPQFGIGYAYVTGGAVVYDVYSPSPQIRMHKCRDILSVCVRYIYVRARC